MSRCNHDPISVQIQITRRVVGTISVDGNTAISSDVPETLRIAVSCLACGHQNVVSSYGYTAESPVWQRWPKWLVWRLQFMRQVLPSLDEALGAIGFDPMPF